MKELEKELELDEIFVIRLKKAFEDALEKVADELEIDLVFYNVKAVVEILDESLHKVDEKVILDTSETGYCLFCRAPTYYFSDHFHAYLCPKCYKETKAEQ